MRPSDIFPRFDAYLAAKQLSLEAVVVGGAALGLLGVITRETRDCDVIDPNLPATITQAAESFAAQMTADGTVLRGDWLNNGPISLTGVLPAGWRERLQVIFRGQAVLLRTLGRPDLLKTKLFALCDRGQDLADCVALEPSAEELAEALPWLEQQDLNPLWPAHVRATVENLARKLGHGV
jgi:hypothetical protein